MSNPTIVPLYIYYKRWSTSHTSSHPALSQEVCFRRLLEISADPQCSEPFSVCHGVSRNTARSSLSLLQLAMPITICCVGNCGHVRGAQRRICSGGSALFAMGGLAYILSARASTILDVDHALPLALFAMGGSAAWHTEAGYTLSA